MSAPSNSQVDKAGALLREWLHEAVREPELELSAQAIGAFSTLDAFRRSFRGPLQKTTVGLRQFVLRESSSAVVGQRLKRTPRIVLKLDRFPTTRLSQMQDVAGCRAVVAGGSHEVAGVLRRIKRNWDVVTIDDYAMRPKPGGYRAIHVVVRRDGRFVEIQLRTLAQHEWAESIEELQAATRLPLKDGKGPEELLQFMQVASDGMAAEEAGDNELAAMLMEQANVLRPAVEPYLCYLRRE